MVLDQKTAFSECRRWRYTLWRSWGGLFSDGRFVQFVMLNPSTADEVADDPTIRRCKSFCHEWGYDSFCVTNLFAYRATDPKAMKAQKDPVGPDNDRHLVEVAHQANLIVAAWGAHGGHLGRAEEVLKLLPDRVHCLKVTKEGHPGHPLYLPQGLVPVDLKRALAERTEISH